MLIFQVKHIDLSYQKYVVFFKMKTFRNFTVLEQNVARKKLIIMLKVEF